MGTSVIKKPTPPMNVLHWYRTEEALPEEGVTVLAWHPADLYPVSSFYIYNPDGTQAWRYESDGPEDMDTPPEHRYMPLLRTPTHWAFMPATPEWTGPI